MASLWQQDASGLYSPGEEIDSSSVRRKGRPHGSSMKQECDLDLGLWDNANSGATSEAEQDSTLSSGVSSQRAAAPSLEGLPPKVMMSITRMQCLLQCREERIRYLERQVEDLQQDRNFLRSQIENLTSVRHLTAAAAAGVAPSVSATASISAPIAAPTPPPPPIRTAKPQHVEAKQRKRKQHETSGSSECHDSASELSVSSVTSEDYQSIRRRKPHPKDRRRGKKVAKDFYRKRATGVQYVIQRYRQVLAAYNKTKNMSVAFRHYGIDRNTIANTAPIAELHLAAKDALPLVGMFRPREDTLVNYAQRCALVIESDLGLFRKIEQMKATGELLPISGKRRTAMPMMAGHEILEMKVPA